MGENVNNGKNKCSLAYIMFQKIISKEVSKFELELSLIYYIALKVLLYNIVVDTSTMDTHNGIFFQ